MKLTEADLTENPQVGKTNRLMIIREVDFGVYLDGEDLGEILMPKKYVPEDYRLGDVVEVFVYLDSEDRLVATTEKPYAQVEQYACLKVVSVTNFGAFLDWGLKKDLLVPFNEQKHRMEEGREYIVYIYSDEETGRIAGTSKLDRCLDLYKGDYQDGDEVELFICEETDLGFKTIINDAHRGLLYKSDLYQSVNKGERAKGFIKQVREDGKIDVTLNKPGYEAIDEVSEQILETLKASGGFIAVTDKSSPDEIKELFGVSKKRYKKAVGALYKKRLVSLEEGGVRVIKGEKE
ncbi:MAG: S1-like domain-containing RNA-binding protein [Deltaproteobacteria bacterium]|nr:S1-like domain-containing RNA-binding protein [Deltaproteobacteria bacterium]